MFCNFFGPQEMLFLLKYVISGHILVFDFLHFQGIFSIKVYAFE